MNYFSILVNFFQVAKTYLYKRGCERDSKSRNSHNGLVYRFFCIKVMKKIEPNNRLYSVWALFIATLFTLFAVYDGLG